jgi:hypothetical protein
LKPFLRRMRTASRPSMSGKPTSCRTRPTAIFRKLCG